LAIDVWATHPNRNPNHANPYPNPNPTLMSSRHFVQISVDQRFHVTLTVTGSGLCGEGGSS